MEFWRNMDPLDKGFWTAVAIGLVTYAGLGGTIYAIVGSDGLSR